MNPDPQTDRAPRLLAPAQRPHLYTGDPRNPYCARCHAHTAKLGRECRGQG